MGWSEGHPYLPLESYLAFTTFGSVVVAGSTMLPFQHSGKRMIIPMPRASLEHDLGGSSWAFCCPVISQCQSTFPYSPGRSLATNLRPLGKGFTLAHCVALKGFIHW